MQITPLTTCILVICSCIAVFVSKLLRFKRYREYLQYGPYGEPRIVKVSRHSPCCKISKADLKYDPLSELQLLYLELRMKDEEDLKNALDQSGLSVAVQDELKLAHQKQRAQRRLEQAQAQEAIIAEQKARLAQQHQEWEEMKQVAATKSLWWQFWHRA